MKKRTLKTTCAALAAVVMVSGVWAYTRESKDETALPQLVSYVDTLDGSVLIAEEEVPLAAKPVVKKTTTTKKTTKKTKMKKKSKKTSKKTSRKTQKSSNTQVSSTAKVKVDTTVLTTTLTKLKKNSKVKTVTTTVKTTVVTTTTNIAAPAAASAAPAAKSPATARTATPAAAQATNTTVAIRSIAPNAHANVLGAFESLGFKVYVQPGVNYSGKFDATPRSIIVKKNSDEAIYHELGHFVAFVAGNADTTSEFVSIYQKEKDSLVATRNNKSYVTSTSAEYFAESYQDYVENPAGLKAARPQTYNYIVNSVAKITDSRVALIKQLYANIWK